MRVNDIETERITSLWNQGKKVPEICRITKWHRKTVANVLERAGLREKKVLNIRSWTTHEVRDLIKMANNGLKDDRIARALDRTLVSVVARRRKLGITFRKHKEWTKTEVDKMAVMKDRGDTDNHIAFKLNRPVGSVRGKMKRSGMIPRSK